MLGEPEGAQRILGCLGRLGGAQRRTVVARGTSEGEGGQRIVGNWGVQGGTQRKNGRTLGCEADRRILGAGWKFREPREGWWDTGEAPEEMCGMLVGLESLRGFWHAGGGVRGGFWDTGGMGGS